MMDLARERTETLKRLSAVAASGDLPDKLKTRCTGISQRLEAPVLIGIFGPRNAGKRRLLNALMGAEIMPAEAPPITLEALMAPTARSTLRFPDGTLVEHDGYPNAQMLSGGAVFASLASPHCQALDCEVLLFECDDTREDLTEALAWAAPRLDLAIWCTRGWSDVEQAAWATTPDRLRDHAILSVEGDQGAIDPGARVAGFDTVVFEGTEARGTGAVASPLKEHVTTMIAEAREQDLLSAKLFLRRYDTGAPTPRLADTRPGAVEPQAEPEAVEGLARLLGHVRHEALNLRKLAEAPSVALQDLFQATERAFEGLVGVLRTLPLVAEAWPELEEAVQDARDLAVLIRYEGREEQVLQSARLLLQLRTEIEAAYLDHAGPDAPQTGRLQ